MSPCKANMGVFVRANSCTRRTGEGYGPLRERLWGFSLFLCLLDEDYQSDGYCMLQQASGKAYFDGYEGESVVWFDEFGGSLFPFSIFLAIVSEWGTRVETKGSSTVFHPKKILISTTRWPCEWWPESRHFNKDPFQLYRRITRLYKLERPRQLDDGSMEYPEPELITDKTKPNWNNDYCEEY